MTDAMNGGKIGEQMICGVNDSDEQGRPKADHPDRSGTSTKFFVNRGRSRGHGKSPVRREIKRDWNEKSEPEMLRHYTKGLLRQCEECNKDLGDWIRATQFSEKLSFRYPAPKECAWELGRPSGT